MSAFRPLEPAEVAEANRILRWFGEEPDLDKVTEGCWFGRCARFELEGEPGLMWFTRYPSVHLIRISIRRMAEAGHEGAYSIWLAGRGRIGGYVPN